jgi:arginyl-tRNA--protein-N-Asp/Glu arginylyltransferase
MDCGPADRGNQASGERKPRARTSREKAALPVAPALPVGLTRPVACPYIVGRFERKLIVELEGADAPELYDSLSRAGFRRSHHFAYRPACRDCAACVPVRIAVAEFRDTSWTRRIRNANRDLTVALVPPRATLDQFRLFWVYQHARHADSEMATMSFRDYRAMIEESPIRTSLAEFRTPAGDLAAVLLIDRLDDGISAVYSFFDPAERRRSLGSWNILWLVDDCRQRGKPYVYLGYWIAESPKMAYKARFPALERLAAGRWVGFAGQGRRPAG